jgi:hypothetical protein
LSILVEVVSADRTKNNNKMAKLSIKFTIPTDQLVKLEVKVCIETLWETTFSSSS